MMIYVGNKIQVPIMLNRHITIKIKFSISMPKTLIDQKEYNFDNQTFDVVFLKMEIN